MAEAALVVEQLADAERLGSWLDANAPELGDGPVKVEIVSGGTSNVILGIDRGGPRAVLRRPPAVPPPGSAKTIQRESTVLSALNETDVPHPHLYARCEDTEVVGAPFYVMERVEGWAAKLTDDDTVFPEPFDTAPWRYGVPYALTDGLIALANVDYKAVGLEGFGKPDNFLGRQVERWSSQLGSYKELYDYPGRDLPGYAYVRDWLAANIPPAPKAGIMHGDVGTPNALFHSGPPARLAALIDWELSTIGDPMLDFAWFSNAMRDEREPSRIPPHGTFDPLHYPTRQDLARYYAGGTGRSIEHLDYYLILALFKGGCILEYKVAESMAGMQSEWAGNFFGPMVLKMFEEGERLARLAEREPNRL
jgi:aminoglycoside phosphotransferase (APT) family kinase protein